MNKPAPPPEVCDADPAAVSAERARELIRQAVTPVAQIEKVALREARGRVLAADVTAGAPVPNHTNSAMDGYALRGCDLPESGEKTFAVIGAAMAGKPFTGEVGAGQCVRIMTGAVLPNGADSVVAQERAVKEKDGARIGTGETPGANVRRAGEDLEEGATAIRAGRRLAPSHIGLAASLGLCELPVFRRPRVAFFSNGDELRALGGALQTGEVYDSNRHTLHGMLSQEGAEITDLGIVGDDADALADALAQAGACADMVITSAGASVGEADYVREILTRLGKIDFWKVAVKPGRPLIFGSLRGENGGSLFFGLPGNPVSVMVTFEIFVKPALRQLAGETAAEPPRLLAKTESALRKRRGRAEYQRGVLSAGADGVTVRSTGEQGSGILRSMAEANCFIILPDDSAGAAAGELVEVLPFSRLW